MAQLTHVCLWTVCIVFVLSTASTVAERPGLQIRVLQSGLNKAAQISMDKLAGQITSTEIPNTGGSSGSIKYSCSNMRITSFTKPGSSVGIDGTSGITWHASNGGLSLSGDWRYKVEKWGITIVRDSGSFTASLSGINFGISANTGKDGSGRLTVYSTGCSCSMRNPSVKIHGSFFSVLYNFILSWARGHLRNKLQAAMCDNGQKAINGDMNQKLRQLRLSNNIDQGRMVVDYSLIRSPHFGRGYMQMEHKGEIRSTNNPRSYSVEPGVFPIPSGISPRMINIWGSDYILNSFTSTAFHQNRVQQYLTAQQLPPAMRNYLRTSCPGDVCIGLLFPKVAATYPNRAASLKISATAAPVIKTTAAEIRVTIPGELILLIRANSGQEVPLFSLSSTITLLVDATLANNAVRCMVTAFRLCISKIMHSSIGIIPPSGLQGVLNHLGNTYIIPKINELGQKGIEVPHLLDTQLINPVLRKFEGGLMYAANIEWPSRGARPATHTPSASSRKLSACAPFTQPTPSTTPQTTTTPPTTTTTTQTAIQTTTTTAVNLIPVTMTTTTPTSHHADTAQQPDTTDTTIAQTPSSMSTQTPSTNTMNMQQDTTKTTIVQRPTNRSTQTPITKPLNQIYLVIGLVPGLVVFVVFIIALAVLFCCRRTRRLQDGTRSTRGLPTVTPDFTNIAAKADKLPDKLEQAIGYDLEKHTTYVNHGMALEEYGSKLVGITSVD